MNFEFRFIPNWVGGGSSTLYPMIGLYARAKNGFEVHYFSSILARVIENYASSILFTVS